MICFGKLEEEFNTAKEVLALVSIEALEPYILAEIVSSLYSQQISFVLTIVRVLDIAHSSAPAGNVFQKEQIFPVSLLPHKYLIFL